MSGESVPKSIASTNTIDETRTRRRRTSPSLAGPKKFTEPGALSSSTPTDLRLPPTGLPERTRPNRVPCSVQGRHYGVEEGRSRASPPELRAICGNAARRMTVRLRACRTEHRRRAQQTMARRPLSRAYAAGPKKFTEPGALSSSTPTDLRLPPTGLPERTRPNRVPCSVQERHYGAGEGRSRLGSREVVANCGNEPAARPGLWARLAPRDATCTRRSRLYGTKRIHRAGCAFVLHPDGPSASAYGLPE